MQKFLLVGLGGAMGSMSRYAIYLLMLQLQIKSFWATFVVNLAGSLVIGILAGIKPNQMSTLLLGIGFCGGFTTFSTFSMDGIKLLRSGEHFLMLSYYALSIFGGLTMAWIGYNWTSK